jgi:DNA-directed RNA polymerase specialized sigma24 family protein
LATAGGEITRILVAARGGGLTLDETAEALQVSARTVQREWRMARAFLHRTLQAAPLR